MPELTCQPRVTADRGGNRQPISLPAKARRRSATPRRDNVKEMLRERARRVGCDGKLPTVVELCGMLGVARATVNSALDGLEAEGIIRRRQGSGIYVTPRIDQKTVALVFGSNIFAAAVSPFYAMLIEHCERRAENHRENFSFFLDLPSASAAADGSPVHRDLAAAIVGGKLHGILLAARNSAAEEEWLRAQGLPVVSLDVGMPRPHTVGIDYGEMIRLGVAALAEQGCRRIGLVAPTPMGVNGVQTFSEALQELGLPFHPERTWTSRMRSAVAALPHDEQGRQALTALFAGDRTLAPDGVMIADDMMTRGALVAARQLHLAVGRDVKIATHANRGSATLRNDEAALIRVEVDTEELVEAMFGMLERLMAGQALPADRIEIRPRLRSAGPGVKRKT